MAEEEEICAKEKKAGWFAFTSASVNSCVDSSDASSSLLDSARKSVGFDRTGGLFSLDKNDFAALGWTGRKAKDQSSLGVDLKTPSPENEEEGDGDGPNRENFFQSLSGRFKQLMVDSRAARNSSDALKSLPVNQKSTSVDAFSPPVESARWHADQYWYAGCQDHYTRSPFTEDVSSPHTPHTPGRLARHLPVGVQDAHSPSSLSPRVTEEASSSAAVTEAVHIQGEPAAGNWSRRWIEWFSQVGEGRTRAASKGGDISAMLDVVVGKGHDSMSVQAREAIIAEGISSPDELQRRAGSIADLVNIGVPYPMARRLQANLRCEQHHKASLDGQKQALPRADQGCGAGRDARSPRLGGVAGGASRHRESRAGREGQGEREASGTHTCAGGQQQHAASTPQQGEVADLMAQFRVRVRPSEDGGGGDVWGQQGRGRASSRLAAEPVERRRHEWEGVYKQAGCAGLAPDLSEWLSRHARCRVQAVGDAGQGPDAAVRRGHEEEERGRGEGGWLCGDTGQDGVCAGAESADAGAGASASQDCMYPGLVQARLTDFTSLWKSTEFELVGCGLSQDVAAQLVVEVKKREQAQLDRLAEAAAAAGTKGLTMAASEMSGALREGAKAIADGSDQARNNYEEEGMRGAGSKMLAAASQASVAAAAGLAKSWQILARVAAADIDDLVSARALGLSFDHGLVSSSFDILSADDSAPDSVIAKYSFGKPTQQPASGHVIHHVCTAVGFALRPGCALHVFDFVVRALSQGALLRLGLLEEIGCINLNVDGSFRTGDDSRSWALTSPGTLVHNGEVHGPRLGLELATGDVVRVIYDQGRSRLRFAYNGILVGRQFDGVCGPVVPSVTCSQDSKCVIQITGYWTA